ncbi:uncharacterized protein VP01_4737g1, partial [Puccinia sorghi]
MPVYFNTSNWTFLSLVLAVYLHVIAGLSTKEANATLATMKKILENLNSNHDQQSKFKYP